ncbi:hypothetical protein LCGC14_0918350 [marine sediment metagenome]|uniref:Uncharacterized protein n=1 Tax=marine sediment metagenome TaxID=412755 RepID=A0A0F9RY69_9ZZZZ|nr:hypothetical protein [bacterium]
MTKISPMQRSLKLLRENGYTCWITEYWNPWSKTKSDLFSFIDIIAIKKNETIGVQTTTQAHQAERVKKILGSKYYPIVKSAKWRVVVHGWRKLKTGWACKIVEL